MPLPDTLFCFGKNIKISVNQEVRRLGMLAKLSSKNQITIPKKILAKLPPVKYFEISYENGAIILRPVQVEPIKLDAIRQKMKKLGLSEDSVAEAVKWAREK
ncbi:hypothetical protein TDIS_0978 [Thermosulfurimonas dismutans]|uniref:SpoVT-AbrB domain-containing protein n=2 Tax=Thermosulfurimonas dismutans TaxID=999894 RepID=A0A179D5Y4_9BACT|nr:hypothetical protein TDIS_0978 [Thermosulfurimonas dismutans]